MNFIKSICRIFFAGIVSVAILCILFTFYSLMPVHTSSELGNTDYVWPANSSWIKITEGIAWGTFDAQGFNNLQVIDNPDILLLGSSHMEATNIMQNQTVSYHLQTTLGNEKKIYNMGISGHHFAKILQYLPASLSLYDTPPEVIIIETSSVNLSPETVSSILNRTIEFTPSHDTGIIATLQRLPFLRLIYQQLQWGLFDLLFPTGAIYAEKTSSDINSNNEHLDGSHYDILFDYIVNLQEQYDTDIIIFYHPTGKLQEDGSVDFQQDTNLKIFSDKCNENGIAFLDMTDSFYEMYKDEHKLPHGFITGLVESGHLNADGHAIIARDLCDLIKAQTEE